MNHLKAKYKIYIVCFVWVVLVAAMFWYGFKIIDQSNAILVSSFADQQHKLAVLQAQQQSYKQATSDLTKVQNEKYPPDQLFSKDTTLVHELETLEALATSTNVNMTVNGLSGTIKDFHPAPTKSSIFEVSYGLSLTGSLNDCLAFLEGLEHLQFVTVSKSLSLNSVDSDKVDINLSAYFYLRPQ